MQVLIDLLKPGGILVTPNEDSLVKVTKSQDGQSASTEKLASVRYGGAFLLTQQRFLLTCACLTHGLFVRFEGAV